MYALAIVAFAAGLILGFFFHALAVIAASAAFVVALILFGSDLGIPIMPGSALAVVLVNIGYLAGAAVSYKRPRPSDAEPPDD